MKKAAIFLSAALIALFTYFSPAAYVSALADGYVVYAYIPAPATLYGADGAPICSLPATYFTVVSGEISDGKYPVSYLDLEGYVRSTDIEIVDYEPVYKFAHLSATPDNDGMAVNMRDIPDRESGKILCTVPASASLTLYGARTGSEMISGAGDEWQYVRYTDPHGEKIYGYVYSKQLRCDKVQPNVIEKVVRPSADSVRETQSDTDLSGKAGLALAAAMCVPAGVIMLVLFYRPDRLRKPRHRQDG